MLFIYFVGFVGLFIYLIFFCFDFLLPSLTSHCGEGRGVFFLLFAVSFCLLLLPFSFSLFVLFISAAPYLCIYLPVFILYCCCSGALDAAAAAAAAANAAAAAAAAFVFDSFFFSFFVSSLLLMH